MVRGRIGSTCLANLFHNLSRADVARVDKIKAQLICDDWMIDVDSEVAYYRRGRWKRIAG